MKINCIVLMMAAAEAIRVNGDPEPKTPTPVVYQPTTPYIEKYVKGIEYEAGRAASAEPTDCTYPPCGNPYWPSKNASNTTKGAKKDAAPAEGAVEEAAGDSATTADAKPKATAKASKLPAEM